MSEPFHTVGAWPGVVSLRRGWGRAVVRPWNMTTGFGTVRLVRGNASFLASATEWAAGVADGAILSPALYPSATRVWKKVGYEPMLELQIMEKSLGSIEYPGDRVSPFSETDLSLLESVDRLAFDDFWHMEAAGLNEAIDATPRTRVFQALIGDSLAGYAIVGTQLGVSFLQRIAVDPEHQGRGLGRELISASTHWARKTGATTMVLNVRTENEHARRLYSAQGFTDTGAKLRVLRYDA